MYNVSYHPVLKYRSKIYIASLITDDIEYDENGNEMQKYNTPISYMFNVQDNNDNSYITDYGYTTSSTKVVLITNKKKYLGKFKEFDRVYINTTPDGEFENGDNADYRISAVRPQNTCIKLFIVKLTRDTSND